MKSKLMLFALLLISTLGFSQTFEVSGKVLDAANGSALPGVNVAVKNSSQFTISDIDGNFKFSKVTSGSKLVFTSIGYKNYEATVTSSQKLTISMQNDIKVLEEVVAIGYGSKKKRNISGSVGLVSGKTIDDLKPIRIEQALQGTVAGVAVSAQSGAPGAGLSIRIRGISTNGDNGPLILIDGYQGDMGILNPNDVESITVLKDAQAAIYGSQGANGVVLITTKSGKKNTKTKFSFNSYSGTQQTTKKLSMLNATEYALLLNESYANGGQSLPYPNASGLGNGTDWQNEVFNNAPIVSNDFSVSGGSDKITYSFSGSDLKQEGIIGGGKSDYKRNTARLSLGADLTDKLKLTSNFIYTYVDRDALNDSGLGSVLFNAINTPATLPVYDTNGAYTLIPSTPGFGIEIINPLAQIDNTFNDYKLKKLNGGITLDYDIIKNVKLTTRMGFNTANSKSKSFSKEVSYGGKVFDVGRNSVSQNTINDNDFSFDGFGVYENTFLESHKIKLTLGTTVYKEFGSGLFATGFDVPNNSWDFADIALATGTSAAGVRDVGSYGYDERRLSHFSRFEYEYNGKYLFSAMIRRDMSTKFGPDNRVAVFPSFTSGWIVSDEDFFNKSSFVNFFKLRASYGLLGNDKIGNNRFVGALNGEGVYVFDDALVTGVAAGVLPNPAIKWEADEKVNFGTDIKLWNNKIDITADYFIDTRKDLLIGYIPVSGITGVYAPGSGSPTINAGTVSNKGFEFAINYKDNITENLKFGIGYNVTTINNEVLKVNNSTGYLESGSFGVGQPAASRMEVGHALGYFYGYQTEGIFQNQAEINASPSQSALGAATAPGDIKFKDINSDGVIDSKDKTDLGNPIADYTMGLNLTLNYKNFDFVAYSYASLGNEMVRNYERTLANVNKLNYVLDRWTGEGTSNTVPRVTTAATNNNVLSSYFVEDASFLRIQNIQLGYTLDKTESEKMGISKLRIYTSVNNLYTFTKYRGFDPAASDGNPLGGGIDYGFYPTPKTFMFGINVNF
jgi:TonB-linked SusC/RagA family outer membrane protein